jgi:hypothetical protein
MIVLSITTFNVALKGDYGNMRLEEETEGPKANPGKVSPIGPLDLTI